MKPMDAENIEVPRAVYVDGYVRNKKAIDAAKAAKASAQLVNAIIALVMIAMVTGTLAVVFWRVTIIVLMVALLGIAAKQYYHHLTKVPDPDELKINYHLVKNPGWLDRLRLSN